VQYAPRYTAMHPAVRAFVQEHLKSRQQRALVHTLLLHSCTRLLHLLHCSYTAVRAFVQEYLRSRQQRALVHTLCKSHNTVSNTKTVAPSNFYQNQNPAVRVFVQEHIKSRQQRALIHTLTTLQQHSNNTPTTV
jgi:hypothetical protein